MQKECFGLMASNLGLNPKHYVSPWNAYRIRGKAHPLPGQANGNSLKGALDEGPPEVRMVKITGSSSGDAAP